MPRPPKLSTREWRQLLPWLLQLKYPQMRILLLNRMSWLQRFSLNPRLSKLSQQKYDLHRDPEIIRASADWGIHERFLSATNRFFVNKQNSHWHQLSLIFENREQKVEIILSANWQTYFVALIKFEAVDCENSKFKHQARDSKIIETVKFV